MYGNTSIHQAASVEEGLKVLKCFMSKGCDLAVKNARGHTPLDLATSDETK
jgi:ankyrin repeat protein